MANTNATMNGSARYQVHTSFSQIVPLYDGFILDQWGVMHNGFESMTGAPECTAELARLGKKLVILSNSPGSERETLDALPKLGFDPDHFRCGAVTSGMLASRYIRDTYGTVVDEARDGGKRRKALFMAWANPAAPPASDFLTRCGDIELVSSVEDGPDVIVVQGNEVLLGPMGENGRRQETTLGDFVHTGKTHEVIDPLLRDCAQQRVPMVCVDPDFATVNPDGSTFYMPGTVAKRYEELGGRCLYFGKPHRPGFLECIERLGMDRSRIVHVGDSIHHDVAGANSVGLSSIMVLGGVHRPELRNKFGELASTENLDRFFEKEGQTPTHVAPLLKL